MASSVAITDRMKYGVKPSAVRSENYLHNIKATNGATFDVSMGQDLIFDVPALGNGYYCDFSTSYFRMRVDVTLNTAIYGYTTGTNNKEANGYVRFERGPESMFRRVLIQDASGNLLESFENYNDLYCLTELLTNNKANRTGPGCFHGEGLLVAQATPRVIVAGNGDATVDDTPFNIGGSYNGKYEPLRFPSLGGAVVANYAMGSGVDGKNPTETKFGSYSLFDTDCALNKYELGKSGGRYYTFQLCSSFFGGSAEKYIPMSAINGMRLTLSFDNVAGSFVINGLNSGADGGTLNSIYKVTVSDPTFYMNMVRVDPTVDAQLIESAKSEEDGNIRIHAQTYSSYQMTIPVGSYSYEYVLPIKVSSLKGVYFTFSPTQWSGRESFTQSDHCSALGGTWVDSSNAYHRVMKTTWFWNNLGSYQFFLDGKPTPASPVQVRLGHSENLAELSRSLHFGHKSGDGQYLSLLDDTGSYVEQNFILGQEFESFSQKGAVIESGINTLNSLLTLRLNFNSGTHYEGAAVSGSGEACYLKVFCLYDSFLAITPGTGIMRTEN